MEPKFKPPQNAQCFVLEKSAAICTQCTVGMYKQCTVCMKMYGIPIYRSCTLYSKTVSILLYTMHIHRFKINHDEQQALMWATKLPTRFHDTLTHKYGQIADCMKLIISILVVGGHCWISIHKGLGQELFRGLAIGKNPIVKIAIVMIKSPMFVTGFFAATSMFNVKLGRFMDNN